MVAFAIIVWVVLCLLFGYSGQERTKASVGFLALASVAVCAYSTGRLYPRRATPDLRAAFLLNAAGLAAIVIWFALSLLSVAWQYLMHRAAQ